MLSSYVALRPPESGAYGHSELDLTPVYRLVMATFNTNCDLLEL